MAPGYCSVCRRNVRGSIAAHGATRSHRLAIVRLEKRRGNRAVGSKAATRRANAGQSMRRNVDNWLAANVLPVKRHRRRPPNDGPVRNVRVTRHYRRKPAVYSTLEPAIASIGRPYRVLRNLMTGEPIRVWYAAHGATR